MLKWKRISVVAADGDEEVKIVLSGMSGKNRVIKHIGIDNHLATQRLRVYRDADQIVDIPCDLLTNETPFLPMDLPLAEGQLCKVGFFNSAGVSSTRVISIGYTEAD